MAGNSHFAVKVLCFATLSSDFVIFSSDFARLGSIFEEIARVSEPFFAVNCDIQWFPLPVAVATGSVGGLSGLQCGQL